MDLTTLPLDITEYLHPTAWLQLFGTFATIGVLAIIFAETGLLIGCILPGDSLLFTAGILTAVSTVNGQEFQSLSLPWLLIGGPLAAIAGAQLGHWLGARYGRKLFERPDSKIFRQEWVEKAEYYFNRFGPAKAVVLARFIPIVRTFLNPLAGMLGMDSRKFLIWNVVGGVIWTDTLFLLGHFLGSEVPDVERYILPGVAVILVLSVIPIIREVMKGRRASRGGGKHSRPKNNGPEESRPSLSGDSYR
ncbi:MULTISPECIES: DedA family protein [Actinomadura]|uniref:DedA family protein n=1 Tax=Actinomadura litoris TaxID=2678616 RepID=A0A7K1KV78_9ACTN|nr:MULTISPECIES: DedA family protein [Actinomadura]MBT2207335.1 DedA family protein [Actinomadura sp. NEAU-AAG7]MUN35856.1 DedA family protein [Actinomadura litoris]